MNTLSAQQLDAQNIVFLDGWVDLNSEKWRQMDDQPDLTKNMIKMLLNEDGGLFLDSKGRLWGHGKDTGIYYPFHIECGRKKYGIRIPTKAAN